MTTAEDICNLSQSILTNSEIVADITSPLSYIEKVYAKHYKQTLQFTLKLLAPNFALSRRLVAKLSSTPVFGWSFQYEYPTDCLKLLGIGEVQDKQNNYAIESNADGDLVILSEDDEDDGLQIRFIRYVTNVAKFTPEFVKLMAWQLALDACMEITKDVKKMASLEKRTPSQFNVASAMNAQENRPIRKNVSKFQLVKQTGIYAPVTEEKH